MNNACEVSIFDVYGTSVPKVPEGYEEVIFRLVKEGDIYLGPGASVPYIQKCKPSHGFPRIILRQKTERKYEKIVSRCDQCPNYVHGLIGRFCSDGGGRLLDNGEGAYTIPDWCPLPKN